MRLSFIIKISVVVLLPLKKTGLFIIGFKGTVQSDWIGLKGDQGLDRT
jgi:hypothetical protein